MNRKRFPTLDQLFDDRLVSDLLAALGVFVIDYASDRRISSEIWAAQGVPERDSHPSEGWLELVHPDDRDRVRRATRRLHDGRSTHMEEIFRIRRRNGTYRWVSTRGQSVADETADPRYFVGVDTDVSRLKVAETRLQRQNEELEILRQVAAVVSSSLDMETTVQRILEQTQRIIPYDTATVQLLENDQLRVIGGFGFDNIAAVMALRFPYPEKGSLSTEAIETGSPVHTADVAVDFPAFVQPESSNPIHSWIGIPLKRHGNVIGLFAADSRRRDAYDESHLALAATIADHIAIALENAQLHDQTFQLAMVDGLTGTGSRHRFRIEGRMLYETARRHRRTISALMIDIDRFKQVNDRFGHKTGDVVLQRIAAAGEQELRASDLIARYGGEEFVVLLPETAAEEAWAVAERIRKRVQRIEHPELDGSVTVSIGIACDKPAAGQGLDTLVNRADQALYDAKTSGRNRSSTRSFENSGD